MLQILYCYINFSNYRYILVIFFIFLKKATTSIAFFHLLYPICLKINNKFHNVEQENSINALFYIEK